MEITSTSTSESATTEQPPSEASPESGTPAELAPAQSSTRTTGAHGRVGNQRKCQLNSLQCPSLKMLLVSGRNRLRTLKLTQCLHHVLRRKRTEVQLFFRARTATGMFNGSSFYSATFRSREYCAEHARGKNFGYILVFSRLKHKNFSAGHPVHLTGFHVKGGMIVGTNMSEQACKQMCDDDELCQAGDYDSVNKLCWSHDHGTACGILHVQLGTSHFMKSPCADRKGVVRETHLDFAIGN